MAHFAKVNQGKVIQVIVAEPEFFETFVDTSPGDWIQTSYNTRLGVHYEPDSDTPSADQSKALRGNFAGVGFIYDRENDVFYPPQPFKSWVLNETMWIWEAPVPLPANADTVRYNWDEDSLSWVQAESNP